MAEYCGTDYDVLKKITNTQNPYTIQIVGLANLT